MICLRLTCQGTFFSTAIMVVTAPMSFVNAIAVEAFKKYILVSLIQNRQPYMQLASSYSSGKVLELETCIETNREKFERDNNLGLVKQVVSSMYKRNIQRLTQAYLTLSLQDIANTVQLTSPKEIHDGEIYATIN